MLPYEKAVGDFLFRLIMSLYHSGLLPSWAWKRVMLWLPGSLGFVFRAIRFVVAFTVLTPLLFWPPAWPALAAIFRRRRDD